MASRAQEGIRALTKAMLVRPEHPVALALQNASFTQLGDRGHHAAQALKVDPVNPDGNYKFDLAHPAQRQVAIDLIKCVPLCGPTCVHVLVATTCDVCMHDHVVVIGFLRGSHPGLGTGRG